MKINMVYIFKKKKYTEIGWGSMGGRFCLLRAAVSAQHRLQ